MLGKDKTSQIRVFFFLIFIFRRLLSQHYLFIQLHQQAMIMFQASQFRKDALGYTAHSALVTSVAAGAEGYKYLLWQHRVVVGSVYMINSIRAQYFMHFQHLKIFLLQCEEGQDGQGSDKNSYCYDIRKGKKKVGAVFLKKDKPLKIAQQKQCSVKIGQ